MDNATRKAHLKKMVVPYYVESVMNGKIFKSKSDEAGVAALEALQEYKWHNIAEFFAQRFTAVIARGGFHKNEFKRSAEVCSKSRQHLFGGMTDVMWGSPSLTKNEFLSLQTPVDTDDERQIWRLADYRVIPPLLARFESRGF